MIFAREFAERLADLILRRRLLDAKRAVIVFGLCRHKIPYFEAADPIHRPAMDLPNQSDGSQVMVTSVC